MKIIDKTGLSPKGPCFKQIAQSVLLALSVLIAPALLHAQNSLGVVEGTITDPKGAVVGGAKVNVLNTETGVLIKTTTNNDGFYSVPSLVPGDAYAVGILKDGFSELDINGVSVKSSTTTTISGVMTVGSVMTNVTVTAQGEMLNKDTAAVTTNMDETLVDNLPYPEQGSLEVALLAPGVKGSQTDPSGLGTENPGLFIANVEPGAQISINGASAGHSAILVDGADVTQPSFARAGITVSSGMAGQVTVISNGVPAQYGRTLGGVVITSTKSGTNEYHGRIQWRHTDPFFQAQPDGLPLRAALHQNFLGFFLGGPVVIPHLYNGHDKTFFFGGFEPARFSNSTGQYLAALTPPELAGNFTGDINLLDPNQLQNGTANQIYNIYYQAPLNAQGFPNAPQYSGNKAYVPVANDDLSVQLANNPLAQFISSQLPTPTNPQKTIFINSAATYMNTASSYITNPLSPAFGDNAFGIRTVANQDNRWAFRIDHTISSTDRMYIRFSNTPLDAQRTYLLTAANPLNAYPNDSSHAKNVLVDETHVFTSSLLNEIKVSYLRNLQNRPPVAAALTQDYAAKYGLTPSAAGFGFPSMSNIDGGIGTNQIFLNRDVSSLLQDDFTIVHGRHKIMVGIDLRRLQSNQDNRPGLYGGNYNFNASSTNGVPIANYPCAGTTASPCPTSQGGVGYAAVVLGLISSFSAQSTDVEAHYRWQYYAGYVQDDFRILPNLTLNLGLRYEIETPRQELNNLQGSFIPNLAGSLNGAAATGAFCFSGACGLRRTIFPISYTGVQPRLGIAWNVRPRLVLRSSYAILRVPLTGLSNTPVPNFGLAANSIGGTTGGVVNNQAVDFISNPVAATTLSALQYLQGSRGPFFTVPSNLTIPYIAQTSTVPYSQQWSFTMQFQLLRKTLIEAGYNGSHGVHLFNNNQNPQNFPNMSTFFADVAAGYNFGCTAAAATATCPGIVPNPYGSTNFNLLDSLLPYPAFYNQGSEINEVFNRQGSSSYNALYIAGTHHFDRGLSMQASFTWSKSLDNDGADSAASSSSGFAAALQYPGEHARKAVSDFDVPARFITGFTYRLPYGRQAGHMLSTDGRYAALRLLDRSLNTVLGDWSTGGIFRAESSTPFLPALGRNSTTGNPVGFWFATTGGNAALPVGINPRPSIVPGIPCINPLWAQSGGGKFGTTYINPQAFTIPGSIGAPAYGDAPRTLANCRSPRQINLDANVSKIFPIKGHEHMNVQLTITATNAFNHPLYFYNGSALNSSSGNNGQIFTSYTQGVNAAPRSGKDNPAYSFSLPTGFTVSNYFGTVNPGFTAQFSRIVQVGAAFNF